jgi:drug/metabolite transporter (DMT)-like permease
VTGLALGLVLASGFIHASWNFLLKKSGGGAGLITLASALSLVIYAPIVAAALWIQGGYPFQPVHLALMAGSGVIHTVYFMLLDRAYRSGGDLSIVYPLARATGPLLTIVVAILVLGERPGPAALGGAILIGICALVLTGNPFAWHRSDARHAMGFALLTGCMIAAYTVWDKTSVAAFLIPPLLYDWGCNAFRVAIMAPLARRNAPGGMARAWSERRKTVLAIALLSPLSYILVLTAMVFTPVSYFAPAREISILVAALMGTQLLAEGDVGRRLAAAAAMVAGIVCLALG